MGISVNLVQSAERTDRHARAGLVAELAERAGSAELVVTAVVMVSIALIIETGLVVLHHAQVF